jgi:hypothetical protein
LAGERKLLADHSLFVVLVDDVVVVDVCAVPTRRGLAVSMQYLDWYRNILGTGSVL